MVLHHLPGPDHLFPFGHVMASCTDSVLANPTLQLFVQNYFPCKYNIIDGAFPGKNFLSSSYSLHSLLLCSRCFCFYLCFPPCKRWQEAKLCPSHLAHHGLNEAIEDVSASNPECVLFIWKAVAGDGASSAGILARHLQTKFYSSAWEGPSRHLPFPGHPCSCPSSGLFPKCCHPRLFNTWRCRGSSGSFRILSEAPDNSLLCCWHGCRSCDSPYFFF